MTGDFLRDAEKMIRPEDVPACRQAGQWALDSVRLALARALRHRAGGDLEQQAALAPDVKSEIMDRACDWARATIEAGRELPATGAVERCLAEYAAAFMTMTALVEAATRTEGEAVH